MSTSSKKVLCCGCWDLVHSGHLAHLKAAKSFGDYLIVAVTSDRWVNKGPGRPYFTAGQRAEMIRSLGFVNEVVISDYPTAVEVIEQFKPDFYIKGPDYKDFSKDVTGEIKNEKAAVEACGGKLVFTDDETFSSSTIINKFFQGWTDEQKFTIEKIKGLGGYGRCADEIERLSKLNALVIGEPIIDIYRFCRPEGISSKSPSLSARFEYEEHYQGGSIAIANHLEDFSTVFADKNTSHAPTKIRYVAQDNKQRIFEVTHIDENIWQHEKIAEKISELQVDVIVAADFGHGLFGEEVLDALAQKKEAFVGLNVQTNSSNFGFNVFTKHARWDYLCLDKRELQLAEHDRESDLWTLATRVHDEFAPRKLGVTRGNQGSWLFTEDNEDAASPAFADTIVDATGAGDAYFGLTTLLLAAGSEPELVTFIGNVFAGLKTKIIGNKASVSKAQLLKAIKGILS